MDYLLFSTVLSKAEKIFIFSEMKDSFTTAKNKQH